MNRIMLAGVVFLINAAGPAFAADCTAHGGYMTGTQIAALLTPGNTFPSNIYACYNNGTVRENNENIYAHGPGGAVWDYKKGPTDTVDPSGQVGVYTGGSNANGGTMAYTYGSSTITYNICAYNSNGNGTYASGLTYYFLNTSTATLYNIVITTGHGTC